MRDMQTAAAAPAASPLSMPEPSDGPFSLDELKMAYRCPAMPMEALRYDLTPTGLHYQVVHWEVPIIEASAWSLDVAGLVEQPLKLSLADILERSSTTSTVTLECAGNGRALMSPRPISGPWLSGGVSTASWTGTPLRDILHEAGVSPDAVEVVFTGADHGIHGGEEQDYARSLPISEAMRPEVLLAYRMNGRELEPQHGFPLRLLVPGWYGMASVKWLRGIEVIGRAFEGFQNVVAYRYQDDSDDPGEPVTRQRVKSLMAPPGISEFVTDRRIVDAGTVLLTGRAWSGQGAVTSVEVAVDGRWAPARIGATVSESAWRGWTYSWAATEGEHELMCRATDAAGNTQPLAPVWNYQGMGNNGVQRLKVSVR